MSNGAICAPAGFFAHAEPFYVDSFVVPYEMTIAADALAKVVEVEVQVTAQTHAVKVISFQKIYGTYGYPLEVPFEVTGSK